MTSKQFLKQLEQEHGLVTPELVVEAARPADSPIHNRFEWDIEEAARKYNLQQARQLIKEVKVNFVGDKQVRAFKNVTIEIGGETQRGYISTEVVMSNKELKAQALAEAVARLEYWQNEYDGLKELDGIINKKVYKKAKETVQAQASI